MVDLSIVMLVYQRVISFFCHPVAQHSWASLEALVFWVLTGPPAEPERLGFLQKQKQQVLKIQENLGEIWKISIDSIVPNVKFRCHFLVKHKLQFLSGKCGCDSTRRPVRDLQDVWEGILGFTLISLTACGVACHWD